MSNNDNNKPQPPSFANLHPPVNRNNSQPRHQGLGIGRDSRTPTVNDDFNKHQGKFFTDCQKEYLASINCRLENYDHKQTNVCQLFFDHYKACRVEENKRRLEENAKRGSFF
jgi:hypothetical protein